MTVPLQHLMLCSVGPEVIIGIDVPTGGCWLIDDQVYNRRHVIRLKHPL